MLALAAQARGVPLYAVADSLKFSPGPVIELAHPGRQQPAGAAAGPVAGAHEEKGAEELAVGWGPDLQPAPG